MPINWFHQVIHKRAIPPYRGGGVDLLMELVDPDTIRLVGSWRSDKILCYFHTTAKSFTEGLLAKMFEHGAYALITPTNSGN